MPGEFRYTSRDAKTVTCDEASESGAHRLKVVVLLQGIEEDAVAARAERGRKPVVGKWKNKKPQSRVAK